MMLAIVLVLLAAGLLCVAYGVAIERRWYRLRRHRLDILPAHDASPIDLLHLSDLHFLEGDDRKAAFLADLPRPDVTVVTGDLLGEPEAVERVVESLRQLRGRSASLFVLGSNDYYRPRPLNYFRYFLPPRPRRQRGGRGRSGDLVAALEADGWIHLKNRRHEGDLAGLPAEVMGLDDAHIHRADLRVAVRTAGGFGLAITHSPDPAPELAALGWDLVVAGHTHGGQVRMPLVGALVTNSHMPTRLVSGLIRLGRTYLHTSPGLGTSKYAPFRFLCRPEATVLELRPRAASPRRETAPEALRERT
jgi:predicted MPP superfamily phosphohydrolase